MSGISVQKFREASLQGTVAIEKRNDESQVVKSSKSFGGKALDWLAGGILKNTIWGSERRNQVQSDRKLAFNLFVGALKKEYGKGVGEKLTTNRTNIDKAIREAFGGKIPKLTAKNVAKMESIAKNFKGQGDAQSLKRNLVVRWWVSSGLDHPGHAAAGIRNRTTDSNAQDKYVSFWPGKSAGGKGEILDALRGKNQEGSLSSNAFSDYKSEIADRTASKLERSRFSREELRSAGPKADKFFADLRGIKDDDEALDKLQDAVYECTADIVIDEEDGEPKDTQTLRGWMKLEMHEVLESFENAEISFDECVSKLKEASKVCISTLSERASFEPKARQKAYLHDGGQSASWGLKAEKFHIPLAGLNAESDRSKFVYFGLNENSMVERYDSLQIDGPKADARTPLLNVDTEELEEFWKAHNNATPLFTMAAKIRDCYAPASDEYKALNKCITDGSLKSLDDAKKFLGDVQKLLKEQGHVMAYKMVSYDENCAGYITNLMERGGAKAFASKPIPQNLIATSPNDTANFAKKVIAEVDRLNKLADEIMSHYDSNYSPTKEYLKDNCPRQVLNTFNELMAKKDQGPIPHEELMKKTRTLVDGISKSKDMPEKMGAYMLMSIRSLYRNAGNPIV